MFACQMSSAWERKAAFSVSMTGRSTAQDASSTDGVREVVRVLMVEQNLQATVRVGFEISEALLARAEETGEHIGVFLNGIVARRMTSS